MTDILERLERHTLASVGSHILTNDIRDAAYEIKRLRDALSHCRLWLVGMYPHSKVSLLEKIEAAYPALKDAT